MQQHKLQNTAFECGQNDPNQMYRHFSYNSGSKQVTDKGI
jgi:hypothetical protein